MDWKSWVIQICFLEALCWPWRLECDGSVCRACPNRPGCGPFGKGKQIILLYPDPASSTMILRSAKRRNLFKESYSICLFLESSVIVSACLCSNYQTSLVSERKLPKRGILKSMSELHLPFGEERRKPIPVASSQRRPPMRDF